MKRRYRIKEKHKINGNVLYYPQVRVWGVYNNIWNHYENEYTYALARDSRKQALEDIEKHKSGELKMFTRYEYL